MQLLQIITGLIFLILLPLLLIELFSKYDTEFKDKIQLRKKDAIIIIIFAIIQIVLLQIVHSDKVIFVANTYILMGYLVFMSYTDQKTKLLYSIVSISMTVIQIIFFILNYNIAEKGIFPYTTMIVPLIICVMSLFRMIGFGDALIYIVIGIYYIQYSDYSLMVMVSNVILTNIMFIVINIFVKIIKRDMERHQPLTIYIAISTFICSILLI